MTDITPAPPAVLRMRDFHGWDVIDRDGEKVGGIADLLLDRRGKLRYVSVEFGFPRRSVLLPIEQLEWGDDRLILRAFTREQVLALPPYDPNQTLDETLLAEMLAAFPWMYDPEAEPWRAPAAQPHVIPLSDAKEFKLEAGAPDLRGWNVFGSDGERAGTVAQLLVDPATRKVRYLDVDLLEDLFHLRDDRHVLVPMESARLKERGRDVWVQGLPASRIGRLPAYIGGPVPVVMEDALAAAAADRPRT